MSAIINTVIAYSFPIAVWAIWQRKSSARAFPLIVGMISYVFISLLRAMVRTIITDGLRDNAWLFYLVSALLSAVCEEVGRYVVFRRAIPRHDRWTDCVSYGIGHGGTEVFLTQTLIKYDLIDCLITCDNYIRTMAFSVAMSVLVFTAVHHAFDKKGLAAAVGLHTLTDIIPALYFCGVIAFGGLWLIDTLYVIGCCYLAYRVYSRFRE